MELPCNRSYLPVEVPDTSYMVPTMEISREAVKIKPQTPTAILAFIYFLAERVLLAIFLGCLENCSPFSVASRLARVLAPYSCGESFCRAFLGKYLSPVAFEP